MEMIESASSYLSQFPILVKVAVALWVFITAALVVTLVFTHKPVMKDTAKSANRIPVFENGLVGGEYWINYDNGSHQSIELKENTVLKVKNWPSEGTAVLTLYVRKGTQYAIEWDFVDFFPTRDWTADFEFRIKQSLWIGEFVRQHGKVYGRFIASFPDDKKDAALLDRINAARQALVEKRFLFMSKGGVDTTKQCSAENCTKPCLKGATLCVDHYHEELVLQTRDAVPQISLDNLPRSENTLVE